MKSFAPLTLLTLLAAGCAAFAQESGSVTINLTARKVITENKTETYQPADKAKPGEVIQYDATCRNALPRAVKDVKPVVPVPKGSVFVDGSARPAQFEASLDGQTFAKPPLTREVKQPDGSLKKEPVPATEYRALRWNLAELAAGAQSTVTARVKVSTSAAK